MKSILYFVKPFLISILFLVTISTTGAQLLQFGASACLRTAGPGSPRGIYTAEGSISFAGGFNLFGSSSSLWIFTINAGAQFDPTVSNGTRFFSELVYWNMLCMGAGFTMGIDGGSFHLMIGEIIPFGFINTNMCFLPPVVVIYLRTVWDSVESFHLDLGVKLKFTIPLNLGDL